MHRSQLESPRQPRLGLCPDSDTERRSHPTKTPVLALRKTRMSPASALRSNGLLQFVRQWPPTGFQEDWNRRSAASAFLPSASIDSGTRVLSDEQGTIAPGYLRIFVLSCRQSHLGRRPA